MNNLNKQINIIFYIIKILEKIKKFNTLIFYKLTIIFHTLQFLFFDIKLTINKFLELTY